MVQYCGSACVDLVEFANALCSGVSLVIDTFQSISRQVSVNLRGDQVCMPEKLLDTPQVGSRIEHVRGEAVS